MANIVNQLDRMKDALDLEGLLRRAAAAEFARGDQDGPMRRAHDAQVQECIAAAKALVNGTG